METEHAQGAPDIAGGTIRLFAYLMAAVFLASTACVLTAGWFLYQWLMG